MFDAKRWVSPYGHSAFRGRVVAPELATTARKLRLKDDGAVDPIAFPRAALKISPEDAKQVREDAAKRDRDEPAGEDERS